MSLRRYQLEVTTPALTPEQIVEVEEEEISGEGESSGTDTAQLRGICEVKQISIDYTGAPEGSKVTVSDVVSGATILSVTGATDKTWRPVIAASKSVGGADSILSEVSLVAERFQVSIEEADPESSISCSVIVREG